MPDSTAGCLNLAAAQFAGPGRVLDIRPLGRGNINETFLVRPVSGESPFVLQRFNTRVFGRPEQVVRNIRICGEHADRCLEDKLPDDRRWEMARVLPTLDGRDLWSGPDNSLWRALSFIAETRTCDVVDSESRAYEVGFGLGMFHSLLSDLSVDRLADTLPGFHVTPRYLEQYDKILTCSGPGPSPEVKYCLGFIGRRRAGVEILENALQAGRLQLRPIHGDPKVNNILFDASSGRAVAMIDLDTVKPGLVHYDIGDCLRSACNPAGEETEDWEAVCFEPELARAVLRGYMGRARDFLAVDDYDYLYEAVRLIAFELGLRFFTDYLAGNVYFRTDYPEHNLVRALVQFKLTESIEARAPVIETILRDFR